MSERRYTEEEVSRIFQLASEAQEEARKQLTTGEHEGMTLAELQEIGHEVGLSTELVAGAARSLDRPSIETRRRLLGFTIGVGRTVELERRLSDEEWEHLVVELRETFDARGRVSTHGSLKQWTNGNLQALLEPTPSGGDRIRLKTTNGEARGLMTVGTGMTAIAFALMIADGLSSGGTVFLMGSVMFALGAFRLPRWARIRREQMERLAQRLSRSIKGSTSDDTS